MSSASSLSRVFNLFKRSMLHALGISQSLRGCSVETWLTAVISSTRIHTLKFISSPVECPSYLHLNVYPISNSNVLSSIASSMFILPDLCVCLASTSTVWPISSRSCQSFSPWDHPCSRYSLEIS